MKTKLTKYIIYLALIIATISLTYNIGVQKYKGDYNRQTDNISTALTVVKHDTIRDSIPVATSGAITLKLKELKDQNLYDKNLIKDLKLKVNQLSSLQNMSMDTKDTVYMQKKDSIYDYKDKWASFHFNTKNNNLAYFVRDSLSTIVFREYAHKFLWFRWGTKGYRVTIVNFNPHSFVTYNQYIRIK